MTVSAWKELRPILATGVSRATREQLDVAEYLGVSLAKRTPSLVAAAKLRAAMAGVLRSDETRPPSFGQTEWLETLAGRLGSKAPIPSSDGEASAWIDYLQIRCRMQSHRELNLSAGDLVMDLRTGELEDVASLGEDGRVYFRGGRGRRAWPDRLEVAYRATDSGKAAVNARRQVANTVAGRMRASEFSASKAAQLDHALVQLTPSACEAEELEAVLDKAADERPLQRFLAKYPHLLGSVVSGAHAQYVLPTARLGSEFVPDFLVADVDSAGIRWVLVELESPRADVTLKTKKQLAEKAREGVGQIHEWREWLQANLDYARRPRSQEGLGLVDIRALPDGLVLVGRRDSLRPNASSLRRQLYESERISVRTYDWLLERVRNAAGDRGVDRNRL